MKKSVLSIGFILLGIVMVVPLQGARFPNAIEKTISVTGDAAVSIAQLLGLPLPGPSSLSLPLGNNDAWAVYLLKQDTRERLWNDNNGSPPRFNTITFSASPVSSLTISPFWLDLGTRLPEAKAGHYSFGSPFLLEDRDRNDPWTRLLGRFMGESDWSRKNRQPFRRCVTSAEKIELCIDVFAAVDYTGNIQRNGYRIEIEAHLNSP